MNQSSIEHCQSCLNSLRLAVKPSRMAAEAIAAQDRLYASAMTKFHPQVVKSACMDWATTRSGFPELSELLELVRENQRLGETRSQPALPSPTGREEFGERIQRLGFRIADLAPIDYSLWSPFMTAHYRQEIGDEQLHDALQRLMRGERVAPRDYRWQPATDAEIMAMWRQNDILGEQMRANPERYMLDPLWVEVFDRFREKRIQDHPELAALYYGGRSAHMAAAE